MPTRKILTRAGFASIQHFPSDTRTRPLPLYAAVCWNMMSARAIGALKAISICRKTYLTNSSKKRYRMKRRAMEYSPPSFSICRKNL